MARSFTAASSMYGENASAVVTAVPLSMACWFNPSSLGTNQTMISLDASTGDRWVLRQSSGDTVGASIVASGTGGGAESTTTLSGTGSWNHAAAVYTSATSRAAYLNGAGKGTASTNLSPASVDKTHIGVLRIVGGSLSSYSNATLAEAAIWNIDLTDDDVLQLSKGYSPLLIRPEYLVAYWPLIGRTSPEIDIVGGYAMTLTNSPTQADHTRVFMPHKALPQLANVQTITASSISPGEIVPAPTVYNPINTVAKVTTALASGQRQDISKNITAVLTGGILNSGWKTAGFPAAGSNPGSLTGAIPTNATTGAIPFSNTGVVNYLLQAKLESPGDNVRVILYDRLWHNSEMSGTVTVDTTLGSVPALTRPDSLGEDTELWVEVYSSLGLTSQTLTVKYTNSQGVTGQTATCVAIRTGGAITVATLAAGDTGVRSVQSYSWGGSTGTVGNFGLSIVRRIAEFPLGNLPGQGNFDFASLAMPQIYDNACLAFASRCSTGGLVAGYIVIGSR